MNRRSLFHTISAAAGLALSRRHLAASQTRPPAMPHYIDTPAGAHLFVRDWGTGKPIVFVHGWAMNSDCWQYQMTDLASRGLRCIGYDRRSHGRSSDPGTGFDFDTLSSDLGSVLNRLDLRDVTLVAHSMGSGEVIRYLTRHGAKRVARIVLVGSTTPFVLKTPGNAQGVDASVLDAVRANWQRDLPKWLADNAGPFFGDAASPEMVAWGIQMCNQVSVRAAVECHRAMAETDFRAEMKKITVPALIIHGDRDVSAPLELTGRRSAALIPGSELRVYKGAPHGLFLTHMERLNRDLYAFATGHAAARAGA